MVRGAAAESERFALQLLSVSMAQMVPSAATSARFALQLLSVSMAQMVPSAAAASARSATNESLYVGLLVQQLHSLVQSGCSLHGSH